MLIVLMIKGHIMRQTYIKKHEFDNDLNIINLKDGLYNILTKESKPHSPLYHSIKQKPFPYNKMMKSQLFENF